MCDDDSTIEEWIETTSSVHGYLSSPRIAADSSTPSANAKRCAPDDETCLHLDAPLGFEELVDKILDYTEGLNTVPEEFRQDSSHHAERRFRRKDLYYDHSNDRSRLGGAPSLVDVDRIADKAGELSEDAESEAAWNCFVHGPVCMLAESSSLHNRSLSIKNSVHATVSPRLLNLASQEGQPIRSKMVDFAIVLCPNEKLASALPLIGRYVDGGVRSNFNHTRYGPLTNKPIVVSIETEPEGESLQEAEVQLAVWAAAHLSRLRDLLDESKAESTDLPWLPLLIAQGPQ